MKLSLISFSFLSISLFAQVIDLGDMGPTHEIVETDLREQMTKSISKVKLGDIRAQLVKATDRRANVHSDLSGCLVSKHYAYKNEVTLQEDLFSIGNEKLYKKGDKRVINFPVKSSICVVDGSNIDIAKKSLDKLLEKGKCSKVMVANNDFRNLQSLYPPTISFYPYHKGLTEAMGVDCLPTRSEAYKDQITIDSISLGEFQ